MDIVKTIAQVREVVRKARSDGKTIGFVPTMGALHLGHVSLMEAAVSKCDFVVVSIFVNPTQFGPGEDLDKYPRDIEANAEKCRAADVDLIFAPEASEMYPDKLISWVEVEKLTDKLCGRSRQGHFKGVTTVCAKLFNIVLPDIAFFGQKDAQQAIVIKRMVKDLNMPLAIEVCPTVREKNGLAVSSRNQYLSEDEKEQAALIYQSLQKCEQLVKEGETNSEKLVEAMVGKLAESSCIRVEYINIVDIDTVADIALVSGQALAAIAVKLGGTRLIDNIILDTTG